MKHTKKALLSSVLSVLLCCSMLIGSTFAWFTDSVTSGQNKIVAGNLDVELEYATAEDAEGGITDDEWKKVESATELFKTDTLWEPGHTEYVYLRVRNAGSLALKYNFGISVYGDKEGNPEAEYTTVEGKTKLSKHLVANLKENADPVTARESLWLSADEETKAIGNLSSVGFTHMDALGSGETDMFTLAIYMPTSVGNEANWVGAEKAPDEHAPQICFGITVNATQVPSERDSFDDQYDKDAPLVAATAAELKNVLDEINNDPAYDGSEKHVVLSDDMTLGDAVGLEVAEDRNVVIDIFGHDLAVEKADRNGILVSPGAEVTITDSQSGGTLTLHSPIIYNEVDGELYQKTDDDLTGGIYVRGDADQKAKLTIEDIEIKMVDEGGSTPIIAENAEVTLGEGAEITTQSYGIWLKENATVTVDGAHLTVGEGVTQHAFVIGNPSGEETDEKCVVNFENGVVDAKHGVEGSVFELCTNGELNITGGEFNLDTDQQYNGRYYNQYLIISNKGGKATVGGDAVINARNTKAKTNDTFGSGEAVFVFSLAADEEETMPASVVVTDNATINLYGTEGYVYMGCVQNGSTITVEKTAHINCYNEIEAGVTYLGMVATNGKIYIAKEVVPDKSDVTVSPGLGTLVDDVDNNQWVIE